MINLFFVTVVSKDKGTGKLEKGTVGEESVPRPEVRFRDD